jgi:DNA polymerase I-like protein with 3'-5' exonuclease and polymerase domains
MVDVDLALLNDLTRLGTAFALDLETALVPLCWEGRHQQRLIQFHNDSVSRWYDLALWDDQQWEALRVFLADEKLEVYGHNLAFDVKCLMSSGVEVAGTLYDTMIASRLIQNGRSNVRHSLGDVAKRTLGRVLDKSLQAQDWMAAELNEADIRYAMNDVEVTWECAHSLHEQVYAQGLMDAYALETALIPVIARMELEGLYVDQQVLRSAVEFYTCNKNEGVAYYIELLDAQLKEKGHEGLPRLADGTVNQQPKTTGSVRLGTKVMAGFNVLSVRQNASYWEVLGIKPVNDEGKVSLDKKNLALYRNYEVVRAYEFFKKADKRATMAQKLEEHIGIDGRIHAQFMPLQTATGRFSCANPNIQQLPRDAEFRNAFCAPEGRVIVQADYSAMELRYLAAVVKSAPMLEAFNSGADLHTRTAALMYGITDAEVEKAQRTAAKACNFGLAFASAAKGLQSYFATLGLYISEKEARQFHKMWHEAYPEVGLWHRQCQRFVDQGVPVRTAIGRRRELYGEENRVQVFANNTIQGGCADIMKAALVSIYRVLPASAKLVATVHDEVLCECPEDVAEEVLGIVVGEMQDAAIPVIGDVVCMKAEGGIVRSWGEK